jgi:hypothetical protein
MYRLGRGPYTCAGGCEYLGLGLRGTLAFTRSSCATPWLNPERVRVLVAQMFQLHIE